MTTRIRRWIETDTGHRVPNHKSKCCHMHGHRYRWEAEIEGDIVDLEGVSEEGMLMDFSDVSAILKEHVHDIVDHAFVVYSGDDDARTALAMMGPQHRTVVVDFIPTAENLAKWAFWGVAEMTSEGRQNRQFEKVRSKVHDGLTKAGNKFTDLAVSKVTKIDSIREV